MAALKDISKHCTLHVRNPKHSVTIGGDRLVFALGSGTPFLVDSEFWKHSLCDRGGLEPWMGRGRSGACAWRLADVGARPQGSGLDQIISRQSQTYLQDHIS